MTIIPEFQTIIPHCSVRFRAIPPIFRICENTIHIGADDELSLSFSFISHKQAKQAQRLVERWLAEDKTLTDKDVYNCFEDITIWQQISSTIMQEMHPLRKLRDWIEVEPQDNLTILIYGRGLITDQLDEYFLRSPIKHHVSRHKSHLIDNLEAYDLIILSDTIYCDDYIHNQLFKYQKPHIYVGLIGSTIIYGPMVFPGRTACQKCSMVEKALHNTAYPGILAHSKVMSHYPDLTAVTLAAAKVAQEVEYINIFRDQANGYSPPATLNTIIKIRTDSLEVTKEKITRQWKCSCNA